MKRVGLVHIYYGKGKGKTTLSLGIALRAWGWGKKVIIFQFFKPKTLSSGEVKAIEKLNKNFKIVRFEEKHPLFCKDIDKRKIKGKFIRYLKDISLIVKKGEYDLVILDEILNVLKEKLISEENIIDLIRNKPESMELVLTGRPLIKKLIKYADYVSEIKEIKHPFKKGIRARRGIEY